MTTYTRLASTDEQEESINKVSGWLKRMGKKIIGGTTIGKSPQTVILDLTYQGGEIHVNSEGNISAYMVDVFSFDQFKRAVETEGEEQTE